MFDYNVSIKGLENIALRTDRQGAVKLIDAFDQEKLTPFVIEQVDAGNPFANNLISIAIVPKPVIKKTVKKTAKQKLIEDIEDAEFLQTLINMDDAPKKRVAKKATKVVAKKAVKRIQPRKR